MQPGVSAGRPHPYRAKLCVVTRDRAPADQSQGIRSDGHMPFIAGRNPLRSPCVPDVPRSSATFQLYPMTGASPSQDQTHPTSSIELGSSRLVSLEVRTAYEVQVGNELDSILACQPFWRRDPESVEDPTHRGIRRDEQEHHDLPY
jgi:hypothetical protein